MVSVFMAVGFLMFLVLGSWFLVLGSWFLVIGSWFLVTGSWLFAFGQDKVTITERGE
jgi:hypothetical protein